VTREALSLAEDLSLSRIFIALECKLVVMDISDGSLGRYGAVISEIRARTTQYNECKFVFEGRTSDFEAHNLDRHTLSL
jgi:hypothetical protein